MSFSLDLNVVIVAAQRTSTDNLFHSLGAANRNALEPIVEVARGSTKKWKSMERREAYVQEHNMKEGFWGNQAPQNLEYYMLM